MKNGLKESKINFLDKIKWRFKYLQLNSLIKGDSPLKRGILKNKIIEEQYLKKSEKIIQILKRMKQEIPNEMNKAEKIIVQTLYQDYMNEKFPNSEDDLNTINISDVINNLEFILNIRKMSKTGNIIYRHLNIDDCKDKNLKLEIIPLLQYSEGTFKKVSFDILKKISFIQEEDFNKISTDDITSIVNAVKRGVDNSQISNYLKICKNYKLKNPLSHMDIYNFLSINMEYSEFFVKYSERYGELPSNDLIYELFEDTRNLDAKEIMLKLGMDSKAYSELRGKFFDYQIEKKLNDGNQMTAKDLITRKYFNIKYRDIDEIIKEKSFSENTQKIINYVTKIQKINDPSILNKLNKEIGLRNIDINIGKVFDEIYNYYAKEKIEGCFEPEKFSGERQTIEYNGKKVEIIKLKGENFRGNIHALGNRDSGGKNLIMTDRESKMSENPLSFAMLEGGSSQLSLSTERDDAMAFFGLNSETLLLGISDLKPENVLAYNDGDGATSIGQNNYNKEIQNVKRKINYNDKTSYDELLVTRYQDSNKIKSYRKDGEKRILPSYILVFTKQGYYTDKPFINYENLDEPSTKRMLEYATTYNIPIVEMDIEKYIEKYESKYDEMFNKMKNGKEKFELKDFESLARYRRSIEFYKSNNSRISDKEIFLKIINDINITPQNREGIINIIEKFDRNKEWERDIKNRSGVSEEVWKKTEEKMQYLREILKIKDYEQEQSYKCNEQVK